MPKALNEIEKLLDDIDCKESAYISEISSLTKRVQKLEKENHQLRTALLKFGRVVEKILPEPID